MVEVKLNQQEALFIENLGLSPEMKATAIANALKAKADRMETVTENREVFSIEINDVGNLVIRGLGNRFPLGLRPDSAELLMSQTEAVKVKIVEARKYIAENPVKVAEAVAKRAAERKAQRKARKTRQTA